MAVGMEDSAEDSSSSATASKSQLTRAGAQEASAGWPCPISSGRLDIASYMCRRQPDCPVPCQPFDRVLHTTGEDNNKEERRFSPSSRCQRNSARERARSRSPQWGNDLRSWFVENTDYDHSAGRRRRRRTGPPSHQRAPRDDIAPQPSNASSQLAPAPTEQSLPRQREQSRSPWPGNDLHSWFVDTMNYDHSAGRRRRTSHPSCDRTARDDTAPGPSNASSQSAPARRAAQEQTLPRQRERSRSPLWGSDCRSWFVVATDYDLSAGRRRRTTRPSCDRAARDDTAAGPSNASSQSAPARRAAEEQTVPMLRERSRSPLWGSDCRSWFVVATDYDLSAGRRRRVSAPKRCRMDKHSGGVVGDRGRL